MMCSSSAGVSGGVFPHRLRLLEALLVQHVGERFAAKHRPPRQQRVQQRAEAVEVGAGIDRPPLGLLGGHVFRRPQHVARGGQPRVAEEPRDAEVGKLHSAVGGQQQVAGLDVAVDHAPVVRVAECAAGLDADPGHLAPVEMPPLPQLLFQAVANDQFHGIEQMPVLLAEAEQADDVRMVQLAEGFDFSLEADAESLFLAPSRRRAV